MLSGKGAVMLKTKQGLFFAVVATSFLLLAACGDDGNSTKASDKIVVDSVEDLSNCVATKVGNLEYVDTVAYVCIELGDKIKWVQVAGVKDNSEDFRACTGKKDGLYSFSPKENTLYVCNDEEWIPVKQLDDNDSVEESSSSSVKSWSSSSTKSSSSEKSSSSTKSSSSKKVESSSSKVSEPAEVTTGSMTDSRDGQTYKTVTIGTQTWMAENLNYESPNSYCYNDSAKYCTKYGRLYTWSAATTACPEGWHLPTKAEFEALFTAVGGKSTEGKMLKSTTGWTAYSGITNEDAFAFSALPAGDGFIGNHYRHEGRKAFFWSSTYWYSMCLSYDGDDAYLEDGEPDGDDEYYWQSVRCLKDGESTTQSSSSAKSSSSSDGSVYDSINNTLKDLRDGQTYKTVTIGSQTWMAENLNNNPSGSYFYYDEFDPPSKYGRVYIWATAKKVCPSGWHLPTRVEFDTLFTAVGGQSTAGKALKSTSGWNDGGNGADAFGFSALPAGYNDPGGPYYAEGNAAYFWTSTEVSGEAYFVNLNYDNDSAYLIQTDGKHYHESDKYSVRCLKD